jgi:succinate dehydrogenase / fumarate reductase cytochrome b subunit
LKNTTPYRFRIVNISQPMDKILYSSLSKKFVLALAGLFLLAFLPVHLYVNLLLLKSDPGIFNRSAHFMATFPVVKAFEVVLMAAFLVHIIWGIIVQVNNWFARPVGYVKVTKSDTSPFSRFMIWTGATVLVFLVLHFFNFYFMKIGIVPGNPEDFYSVAYRLFKIPAYNIIYIVSFIVLGFHLYHALYSAFQTLGVNSPVWTPTIKVVSAIYAIVIPAGFAFISV